VLKEHSFFARLYEKHFTNMILNYFKKKKILLSAKVVSNFINEEEK
jgi:hypothetical protein